MVALKLIMAAFLKISKHLKGRKCCNVKYIRMLIVALAYFSTCLLPIVIFVVLAEHVYISFITGLHVCISMAALLFTACIPWEDYNSENNNIEKP